MGLPPGIGPHSPPKNSPNQYRRGVVVALTHVGTTDSGLSTPPASMRELSIGTPSKS